MLNIVDYYQKAMISQNKPVGEDCYAYSMDGHPDEKRGGHRDMAKHVGLPSCHCCDCFIFEENAISLIEITDIWGTKKKLEKEFSYLTPKNRADFFIENITTENTLKMYGSMAVLCWFARECKTMENNLKKRYNFWVVIPDAKSKHASKAIKRIEIKLKHKLKSDLRSVTSDFIIETVILSHKELEEKIRENAVSV